MQHSIIESDWWTWREGSNYGTFKASKEISNSPSSIIAHHNNTVQTSDDNSCVLSGKFNLTNGCINIWAMTDEIIPDVE